MNQPDFPDNLPNGERYRHWHYNPVTVNAPNTVGAVFLGIVCIILLIIVLRQLKEEKTRARHTNKRMKT